MNKCILFAVALFAFSVPSFCKIKAMGIEELILTSDYIVVGNVVSVSNGNADLNIIKTLKGNKNQTGIEYRILHTGDSDLSDAVQGEKVLLFLSRNKAGKNADTLNSTKDSLCISFSGRGRMPFCIIDGIEHVNILTKDLWLPKHCKTVPAQDQPGGSVCSVKYLEIKNIIIKTLKGK
jgi:hypothetical protein